MEKVVYCYLGFSPYWVWPGWEKSFKISREEKWLSSNFKGAC
jgi:hypothetical protein